MLYIFFLTTDWLLTQVCNPSECSCWHAGILFSSWDISVSGVCLMGTQVLPGEVKAAEPLSLCLYRCRMIPMILDEVRAELQAGDPTRQRPDLW